MALFTCKGWCIRHPNYSERRLVGVHFRANIDAICRKCNVYFKNMKENFCKCCGNRLSRHVRKGKNYRQRILSAFADFWRMILREKKQYDTYRQSSIPKAAKTCLLCGSSKTSHAKNNGRDYALWTKCLHGVMCSRCYNRERYSQGKGVKTGLQITLPYNRNAYVPKPHKKHEMRHEIQGRYRK